MPYLDTYFDAYEAYADAAPGPGSGVDLTLDCAAGHVHLDMPLPGDDFGLVNDLEVTRPGGATQRARNQASIDEYGLYRDSLEAPAVTDNDAQAIGNWRVGNYGDPRVRIPTLTISLAKLHAIDPALVHAVLRLEIGSLVRLTNLPTQAPGTSVDVFVEGWTETIDPAGGWSITLNCSPADFYTVAQLGLTATVTLPTARVALGLAPLPLLGVSLPTSLTAALAATAVVPWVYPRVRRVVGMALTAVKIGVGDSNWPPARPRPGGRRGGSR